MEGRVPLRNRSVSLERSMLVTKVSLVLSYLRPSVSLSPFCPLPAWDAVAGRPSSDASPLILDLSASRTARHKSLSFINYPVLEYSLVAAPNGLGHPLIYRYPSGLSAPGRCPPGCPYPALTFAQRSDTLEAGMS